MSDTHGCTVSLEAFTKQRFSGLKELTSVSLEIGPGSGHDDKKNLHLLHTKSTTLYSAIQPYLFLHPSNKSIVTLLLILQIKDTKSFAKGQLV